MALTVIQKHRYLAMNNCKDLYQHLSIFYYTCPWKYANCGVNVTKKKDLSTNNKMATYTKAINPNYE